MNSSTSTSEPLKLWMRALGVLFAGLVLLAAMELVLRLLPTPSGPHRQSAQSQASSARFVPNHPYTFSMGWDLRHVVHGKTNSMGFLSPHEYSADRRAIALIGDSFAEGEMLAYSESLAGNLDARFRGGLTTFNFGLSGAALPHYLGLAREMGAQFPFDAAVIIVGQGDYVEGFLDQEGLYKWTSDPEHEVVKLVPAEARPQWKQVARESALLHYLRENLKFSPSILFAHSGSSQCTQQQLSSVDRVRMARYVDALGPALRLAPGRIVLVFNSNTRDVYDRVDGRKAVAAANECLGIDALAIQELKTLASARGMQVVEVEPLLEAHYRAWRRQLDFRPVDSHWNGLATSVIADEVVRVLGGPVDASRLVSASK